MNPPDSPRTALAALPAARHPPDTSCGDLLQSNTSRQGENYNALKANDKKTLDERRSQMAKGEPRRAEERPLAYGVNLYTSRWSTWWSNTR